MGELEPAERVFEAVIQICTKRGDRFHLAVAHNNRTAMWSAKGTIDQMEEDLNIVIALAREGGYAWVERAATHNLAENRLWQGDLDQAARLATRGIALAEAYGEANMDLDHMLLARVAAARGSRDILESTIAKISGAAFDENDRRMFRMLVAVATDVDDATWASAVDALAALPAPQRIEMTGLATRKRALEASALEELKELRRRDPIWGRRKTEF